MTIKYTGKVRLFRVDDDGEFYAFAATSEGDAMYRHVKRWHDDTGDIPEAGCEVSEYPPECMIEIGGDDPDVDMPDGAHFDKDRRLACATAAQWAAKYEADGGSEYPVFQSIY